LNKIKIIPYSLVTPVKKDFKDFCNLTFNIYILILFVLNFLNLKERDKKEMTPDHYCFWQLIPDRS